MLLPKLFMHKCSTIWPFSLALGAIILLALMATACTDGQPSDSIRLSNPTISNAALSEDGHYALIIKDGKIAQFWDLNKQNLVHTLTPPGQSPVIADTSLSNDGRFALTSDKQNIHLWGLNSGSIHASWPFEHGKILDIAVSKDGRHALIASNNGSAYYVELGSGKTLQQFKHANQVNSVALSNDQRYALTGSHDKTAKLWDLNSGKLLHDWGHEAPVNYVIFSHDGRFAMSSGQREKIKLWHTEDGSQITTLAAPPMHVTSASFSPAGDYIAAGCSPQILSLWSTHNGKHVKDWIIPKQSFLLPTSIDIHAVRFSPSGNKIITEDSQGYARHWKVPQQE